MGLNQIKLGVPVWLGSLPQEAFVGTKSNRVLSKVLHYGH
jgi:hypothetical protein